MSASATDIPASIRLRAAVKVWSLIGLISFGGPAGQIAMMHKELVEKRKWIDEARFLHALNYCMLLPGPEAQQLAIYIGWLMHRTIGGVIAGLLFIAPGAIAMLGLSIVYVTFHEVPLVAAIFLGLRAAVLALVISAMIRIAKRALLSRLHKAIALSTLSAVLLFAVPFPLIIIAAGTIGWISSRSQTQAAAQTHQERHGWPSLPAEADKLTVIEQMANSGRLQHCQPATGRMLRTLLVCVALWASPLALIAATLGTDSIFFHQATFFSKTAVVTFGGAYAVLSYVGQRAVSFGWLLPQQMMTGLGLAESTPGPLILVLQFVGFVGGYHHSGTLPRLLAGVFGSAITLWVTFVPCFLWILVGAPFIERIRNHSGLQAALACTSAAVVGVITNLAVTFAFASLFGQSTALSWGPVLVHVPIVASIDIPTLMIAIGALIAIVRFKVHVLWTLLASIAISVILYAAT